MSGQTLPRASKRRRKPLIPDLPRKLVKPVAPPTNMTAREYAYAMYRGQGVPARDAAEMAGYSVETSRTWSRLDDSPNVKYVMRQIAEGAGITPERLMSVISDGLDATTVKEFCTQKGILVEGEERVDHQTRLAYAQFAVQLLQMQAPKDDPAANNQTTNVLVISERFADLTPDQLLEAMQKHRIGVTT